jgi:hypothetical protein
MKKFSVSFDNSLIEARKNGELAKNPKAFRHVQTGIMLVIEAAMTGQMPEPMVPVFGGMEMITFNPYDTYETALRVNRARCELFSGPILRHLGLGARIDFINKQGETLRRIEVGADSDGIRYIRETSYVRQLLHARLRYAK